MKNILTSLMATLLVVAFSQSCLAQFDGPATNPSSSTGSAKAGFRVAAVPTSQFRDVIHGITLESNGGLTPGLKVVGVDNFSLGQRNGLEDGDVILEIDRITVSSPGAAHLKTC